MMGGKNGNEFACETIGPTARSPLKPSSLDLHESMTQSLIPNLWQHQGQKPQWCRTGKMKN